MKKYEILLDRKFTVFITAASEEEAKQKAKKLYGGEAEAIEE